MSYVHIWGQLILAILFACNISQNVLAQTTNQNLSNAEMVALYRLMQYDYVLDSHLSSAVGLCVDELMGGIWLLPDAPSSTVRNSVTDRVRQAAENCAVATTGEKSRLVAELRAMTERQLKMAARLGKPVADARLCIATSPSTSQLRNCVTLAMGRPPLEPDWVNWVRLYERRTSQ